MHTGDVVLKYTFYPHFVTGWGLLYDLLALDLCRGIQVKPTCAPAITQPPMAARLGAGPPKLPTKGLRTVCNCFHFGFCTPSLLRSAAQSMPSDDLNQEVITEDIEKECSLGRMLWALFHRMPLSFMPATTLISLASFLRATITAYNRLVVSTRR